MNEFVHLNEDVVFVEVYFPDTRREVPSYGKTYSYKALKKWSIEEGDKVIVAVNGYFKIVEVVSVSDPAPKDNIKYKWIVQKLDTSAYDNIVRKEADFEELVETLKKRNHRKAYLDELHRQVGTENLQAIIDFLKED